MSEEDFSHLKVLLAEDNDQSMKLVRMILNDMGVVQIFTVQDGREAVTMLEERGDDINFIISDWNMPRLSGLELLQHVRQVRADIPFLMITARANTDSVLIARDEGVSAYIAKPFSPFQLESKVRTVWKRFQEQEAANPKPRLR